MKYLNWTPQQRRERCLAIEDLIAKGDQSDGEISQLRFEQGNILAAEQDYDAAIARYDEALKHKSDNYIAWNNRGNVLSALGRYEAAIASYDKTIELQPDKYETW